MADTLLILHGYSDGATSFTGMRDFFISSGAYRADRVFLLNYASMDDESGFHDFADKLDEDYAKQFAGRRIDLACHSTGSLVARAWLRLHYQRARAAGELKPTSPVEHLLLFAPANFGSDLAKLGQSFLGKFRCTFFNSHRREGDAMESGRQVLQGLEPASPFQWDLSADDLHGEGYFDAALGEGRICYPFVLAAGRGYGGIEARLIPARDKPGTDGTVRICGTSLNTRKCVVDFSAPAVRPAWVPERKPAEIPLAIFGAFNHGSLIEGGARFAAGPGTLALEALRVQDFEAYAKAAARFRKALADYRGDPYQQFFFRVRDDVGLPVKDYYIDFHVVGADGRAHRALTLEFDDEFEGEFYRHSADPSCRALLLNCAGLRRFLAKVRRARARLVFDVSAVPPGPDIRFLSGHAVVYDGAAPEAGDAPTFLYENTTTLVEIVLNRVASDRVLHLLDHDLQALRLPPTEASTDTGPTGRAQLF